ncbi:MAG: hypothetical protein OIF35_02270 [Cellvibrionaceae bacterium]|nr:hypothetical protein [Cellvibrionaceae bacterium]MCV6627147.1 hypothetical protein [Cellvibrionaceae bacterium]
MNIKALFKNTLLLLVLVLVSGFVAITFGFQLVLPWLQQVFMGQIGLGAILAVLIWLALVVLMFIAVLGSLVVIAVLVKNREL